MEFSSARAIEMICWQMRLADYPRSLNRALIDGLANGAPPYADDEAIDNGIEVNVNDLTLTRLSHDARMQLYQGFNKPGNFFTCRTDGGAVSKRAERGLFVTSKVNRFLKESDCYYQCQLSKFAGQVLHGIGPSCWERPGAWKPTPLEVADVLVPSNTLLSFSNLPFFAIWRGYTPRQLRRLTRDAKHNPGWNMPVVERALAWADEQTAKLYGGTTWAEYWVPEKRQERFKADAGLYASDLVQTIDCWDFYYWDDAGDHEGWRRRIIFDAQGGHGAWNDSANFTQRPNGKWDRQLGKNILGDEGLFLYNSGDRVVADRMSQIIHFQFADLSAVSPFRYHSVRSLGFLLFAVCHLQNRLRCAFSESVFENLMMYMRVNSLDEAERALKIEMGRRGIIDQTVQFLTPQERWQPNPQLIELGLNEYKQTIADNSSSYVQNQNLSRDRVEKTKFQVMAEVNAMQTLVSAALQQAYRYQTSEYREIFRRFMQKESTDPDVLEFRAACISHGIPNRLLVPDAWEIEPERIVGGGNKTLEMAIAQQLMEWRGAYAPAAQQEVLRMATLAITDDASTALTLVPPSPGVSVARHDAQLAFGSLMAGSVVEFREDSNRIEICQTLLTELKISIGRTMQMGGTASMDKIAGYDNVLIHVSKLIQEVAADKPQKQMATMLAKVSGKLANQVKAFKQRLAQQMKAEQTQGGDGGEMAKTRAKIMGDMMMTQAKAANTRESHAQRTAQRQAQWELEQQQAQQEHSLDMQKQATEHQLEMQNRAAEHALDLRAEAIKIRQKEVAQEQEPSSEQ